MEKLFMVTCDQLPRPLFFKCESEQAARFAFSNGMTPAIQAKYTGDPSFICSQVLSLDEWLPHLPDEFVIDPDVSF